MITIEKQENGRVLTKLPEGTSFDEIIVGIECLIETIMQETGIKIDDMLQEVKRIYERDRKVKNGNEK